MHRWIDLVRKVKALKVELVEYQEKIDPSSTLLFPLEPSQAPFLYFICPCWEPAFSPHDTICPHSVLHLQSWLQRPPPPCQFLHFDLNSYWKSLCLSWRQLILPCLKLKIFPTSLTTHQIPILGMVPPPPVLVVTPHLQLIHFISEASGPPSPPDDRHLFLPLRVFSFLARGIFSKHRSLLCPGPFNSFAFIVQNL